MRYMRRKLGVMTLLTAVLVVTLAPTSAILGLNNRASAIAVGPAHAAANEAAQTRLETAKLRFCQNREQTIDHIMKRIANRGQKHLDLFTSIATRVEAFYTKKGKTLGNYDQLVATVNSDKAAAQAAVDKLAASSTGFTCGGENPRGAVQTFKSNLKLEIQALQTYRTAVKNLTVGVKSAQGTTSSSGATQ